ncbi:hypothetical protein MANES_05G120901v8 [Manihot esculenta]|uniref:Uncharacterized protein n=1 Tax=Manihot esculenta TaxID=3983 RepID=A0ACB7HQX1_MANES|nr:hypothetical protein MANES_05G120901v8 [Manihot esculenta]
MMCFGFLVLYLVFYGCGYYLGVKFFYLFVDGKSKKTEAGNGVALCFRFGLSLRFHCRDSIGFFFSLSMGLSCLHLIWMYGVSYTQGMGLLSMQIIFIKNQVF